MHFMDFTDVHYGTKKLETATITGENIKSILLLEHAIDK